MPWRSIIPALSGFIHKLPIQTGVVAVLVAAAICFAVGDVGIGTRYRSDQFVAQAGMDEYNYAHCAARMVRTGHWATPMFLNRYSLNKPPLLMWAGAVSMWLFGVSAVALRLPVMLAAIAAVMLIYLWLRRLRGLTVALAGAVLLFSDPLFHAMARTFMTDIFLTAAFVAAASVLRWDPRLERRWSGPLFGVFTGCAVLSKSIAGLLPLLMLACF